MHRFFLTPEYFHGTQVSFPQEITHQIIHVLRLGEGDQVAVLDNSGLLHQVSLHIDIIEGILTGTVLDSNPAFTEPKTHISLYFGLSSREKMEWILQKGTEVGVSAFCPFYSSRTLGKPESYTSKKLERWERITREAAEQSGRGKLPAVHQPQSLENCLSSEGCRSELRLIAWEGASESSEPLVELLKRSNGTLVSLFVGPEGGFSEDEVELACAAGCQVVSLGKRILRMETAAIIFPALVLYQLGEM